MKACSILSTASRCSAGRRVALDRCRRRARRVGHRRFRLEEHWDGEGGVLALGRRGRCHRQHVGYTSWSPRTRRGRGRRCSRRRSRRGRTASQAGASDVIVLFGCTEAGDGERVRVHDPQHEVTGSSPIQRGGPPPPIGAERFGGTRPGVALARARRQPLGQHERRDERRWPPGAAPVTARRRHDRGRASEAYLVLDPSRFPPRARRRSFLRFRGVGTAFRGEEAATAPSLVWLWTLRDRKAVHRIFSSSAEPGASRRNADGPSGSPCHGPGQLAGFSLRRCRR